MKAAKWCGLIGLVAVLISPSFSEAHMIALGTKPVAPTLGFHESHHNTRIIYGSHRLDGSKPVLLMLGETPRTTLTTSHLRREPWRYERFPYLETKPVMRMLSK